MTDLLVYANSIKATKEEIRTLLNNRGIPVSTSEKFSTYPAKIDLLGRVPGTGTPTDEAEILTVKNNTGSTLNAGDKVFLYCAGNVEVATKKTFPGDYGENCTVVSRGGDKVFLSYFNQIYNTFLDTTVPAGVGSSNTGLYRRIFYMSNGTMISDYSNSASYVLFPNQYRLDNIKALRHNWYMRSDGHLLEYNVNTGESIDYGFAALNSFENDTFLIIDNKLFFRDQYDSYFYKWNIDTQNHTLGEQQTFTNPNFITTNLIGATADNKYVMFVGDSGTQLTIMRYNNGELSNVATVNNMCEALTPYYNSSNGNYHFSFNEFTGNLHVITLNKFLVFHYENDSFELILEKNLDFSDTIYAPTIDDNLSVCSGGRVLDAQYFYMFPSETDAGYAVVNPSDAVFSETTITGIVKVGGATGTDVQVIIPRFPTTTVTVTTDTNDATIEQV